MKNINTTILIWLFLSFIGNMPAVAQNISPTGTQNHVVTYSFRQALTPSQVLASGNIDQAVSSVTYYDSIGKAVQSVEAGGTSGKEDLVPPVEYAP